jgi:hypothetical protein
MTIGVPSYGGDQTQRLAAPVRKYVGLCNHQFRHPQQYASGHITVSPTQHCSLYILVQPNRTNAFYSFFMVRNSATVKIRPKMASSQDSIHTDCNNRNVWICCMQKHFETYANVMQNIASAGYSWDLMWKYVSQVNTKMSCAVWCYEILLYRSLF